MGQVGLAYLATFFVETADFIVNVLESADSRLGRKYIALKNPCFFANLSEPAGSCLGPSPKVLKNTERGLRPRMS